MADGDLCTLEQVREFLRTRPGVDDDDDVIASLITRASRVITTWTGREFITNPTAGAVRTFVYTGGGFLSLAPYDLRTVDSVVLDSDLDEADRITLTTSDYRLRPKPSPTGTFTWLELPNHRVTRARPEREVTVTGTWGFAEVPDDVVHAAVVTVVEWMRGGVQAFSRSFSLDEGRLNRPEELPSAVKSTLAHYRHVAGG